MNRFKKVTTLIAGVILSLTLSHSTALAADYTVVKNDSLYLIGKLFNTSASTLTSNNQLSSSLIYPGQILNVPATIYTVKQGDTLYLISARYRIPLSSLRKANNKWNNLLLPGQKLILPGIKLTQNGVTPATSSATSNTTTTSNTTQASTNLGSASTNTSSPSTSSGTSTSTSSTSTSSGAASTSTTSTSSSTVIPYTAEEFDLLARLITAEATGEPYNAMVACGAVVVNRVQSPDWPSSISSVINQVTGGYYQFTPVKNGYINNPASEVAKKAAMEALKGSDPSNGSIFYFDDSCTNQWLLSKKVGAKIGSMTYVY